MIYLHECCENEIPKAFVDKTTSDHVANVEICKNVKLDVFKCFLVIRNLRMFDFIFKSVQNLTQFISTAFNQKFSSNLFKSHSPVVLQYIKYSKLFYMCFKFLWVRAELLWQAELRSNLVYPNPTLSAGSYSGIQIPNSESPFEALWIQMFLTQGSLFKFNGRCRQTSKAKPTLEIMSM